MQVNLVNFSLSLVVRLAPAQKVNTIAPSLLIIKQSVAGLALS